MRVVILDGSEKSYNFDTALLTIGRADDNVLQLDVPGVSRYHCKVEKVGNSYFISDLKSTNGIYVNEVKVQGAVVLCEGDIVRLHDIKLQFFDLGATANLSGAGIVFSEIEEVFEQKVKSPQTASSTVVEKSAEPKEKNKLQEVKDLSEYLKNNRIFQKNHKKSEQKSTEKQNTSASEKSDDTTQKKHPSWVFYAIVFFVVVSLVSLFFILVVDRDIKDFSAQQNGAAAQNDTAPGLYLDYVKEIISEDNIYRYHVRIEKNKAFLSVDDVKSQLSVGPVQLQLEDIDLARLRQSIGDSNFLKMTDNNYEKFENSNNRDSRELTVILGNASKTVKIVNSERPIEFMDIEDSLDLYIQSCDLPFLTLSTEDLKERAIESFHLAEDLFANYEANYGNLKKAIREYNLVKEYLRGFSPEPNERKEAIKRLDQAEKIRKQRFQSLRAEYDSFVHKKDFASAREVVVLILELYGEDTREYEYFRDRLIKLDEILRSANRKGKNK